VSYKEDFVEEMLMPKRLVLTFLAVIFAPGTGWVGGTFSFAYTSHAMAAHSPTRCYTSQLSMSAVNSSGGVGHIGVMFRFRNKSSSTCTLNGYPGAQLLDAKQHKMPTHVSRGQGYLFGNQKKQLVTLHSGGYGYFGLEWSHVPTGNQPCPFAHYVKVTPPNDFSSIQIKLGSTYLIDACGGGLTVTTVVAKAFNA
jgi:Protein of unknown function (DUF4232)